MNRQKAGYEMNIYRLFLILFPLLALLFSGCATRPEGITQVATIDALLAGVYDGHTDLRTLRHHGNFGIGTFEALDGEMVLLDGHFYQVRADGKVYRPALSNRTPFACVADFVADQQADLTEPLDLDALEARIDQLVPEPNRFCTFRIHGDFDTVKTRSVPAQAKPYPPLAGVTKTQPVFELGRIRGTLIGFRSPEFVKGVNVPGYHLHFLADDLSAGGHVLGFELARGELQVDSRHDWLRIELPPDRAFRTADLARDRAQEMRAVETDPDTDAAPAR